MKTISGFQDSLLWIQCNSTLRPMGKMHPLSWTPALLFHGTMSDLIRNCYHCYLKIVIIDKAYSTRLSHRYIWDIPDLLYRPVPHVVQWAMGLNSCATQRFKHVCLHAQPQYMQVTYTPEEPQLFWFTGKTRRPPTNWAPCRDQDDTGSRISGVYLWSFHYSRNQKWICRNGPVWRTKRLKCR